MCVAGLVYMYTDYACYSALNTSPIPAAFSTAHSFSDFLKWHSLLLELKLNVLERIYKGERNLDTQRAIGLSESTVRAIQSNADAVRKSIQTAPISV